MYSKGKVKKENNNFAADITPEELNLLCYREDGIY